ncbi:Transmembrane protein [Senna tora]|uniref:Transmembrane protein n=1 Tax=Senna tora TaxID=362788 RepID=A0A834XHV4_9FABA|nr:Transmembrane protein [Senna tora]
MNVLTIFSFSEFRSKRVRGPRGKILAAKRIGPQNHVAVVSPTWVDATCHDWPVLTVGSRKQIITSGLVGEAEKPRIGVIRRRVLKSSKGRKATSSSSSKQENHIIHHDQSDDDVGVSWVSWRVPHHKKRGNKNPGFNLDYSPPKTHPPSHN